MTQKVLRINLTDHGQLFWQKKGEELPQLCVCNMDIEASSLPLIAIHTQLWQLLFHPLIKSLPTQYVRQHFGQHLYFFEGIMRLIKFAETREFRVVKLSQFFNFPIIVGKLPIQPHGRVVLRQKIKKMRRNRQWTHVQTYETDVFAMNMLSSIPQATGDKLMEPKAFYCVLILVLRRLLPEV